MGEVDVLRVKRAEEELKKSFEAILLKVLIDFGMDPEEAQDFCQEHSRDVKEFAEQLIDEVPA